ncbi:DUF4132 domain-containing protein [Kitasatospora phosalacinea]|uniref:DUF4132 domain-containing protein n=1 Tax=Kitasatospora phosalacinea TaxID=2065 RepID=UPI002554F154|nr:DUF4132 domain-containing protein [Kitasatospora phosalacinea]
MQRWELVDGGGSATFWEAEVDGAAVRVRYGRVGDGGRLQIKELSGPAAAAAHLAKLVGQKERAGYRAVGGGAGLPDEGPFVLPAAWRPLVLPRRGGAVAAEVAWPGPEAVAAGDALVAGRSASIANTLGTEGCDPGLVRAARAYLDGAADPLGAACTALLLPSVRNPEEGGAAVVVDGWAARHGLAFAALAAVESFEVEHDYRRSWSFGELTYRDDGRRLGHYAVPPQFELLSRARRLLAVADRGPYEEALAALAAVRSTPRRRVLAAVLVPGAGEWVTESVAEQEGFGEEGPLLRTLLLLALGTREQVDRLGPRPKVLPGAWTAERVATLADGLGADCVPLLAGALPSLDDPAKRRELAGRLLEFPGAEALDALIGHSQDPQVAPVLVEAVRRRPVGGLRRLAAPARGSGPVAVTARHLLDVHLAELLPVPAARLSQLDPADAGFLAELERSRPPRVPVAAAGALPAPLVVAPWETARKARAAAVVDGLAADSGTELVWQPGERAQWALACPYGDHGRFGPDTDWAAVAPGVLLAEPRRLPVEWDLLMSGPVEVLAPFASAWRPAQFYLGDAFLHPVLAKYGAALLPAVLHCVRERPALLGPTLLPVLSAEVARLLATGLTTAKPLHGAARAWFARHGVAGALLLVPEALGASGPARRAAEQALRLVAAEQGRDALLAAVDGRYGAAAGQAAAELLSTDPLVSALPVRMPAFPAWLRTAGLPPVLLADGGGALPESAVRHLVTMLALSAPGAPYPGLAVLREACTADSLAAFCWAVFEQWRLAGIPVKDRWALHALGEFGNDATARLLAPVLRNWPRHKVKQRAVDGLDVLVAIGTDTALAQLHGLTRRTDGRHLDQHAQRRIEAVAAQRGLSPQQLADRLVPDLELAADGSTVIDYGSRRFTVGFDEQLRPYVRDADGRRRKDLPAPGARDDQERATAERKRFATLKKDVRTLATDQIARLETAMVTERTWSTGEFTDLLVDHPLLGHLVRRLLWTADGTAFRVAEDRTFTDVHDEPFHLTTDAVVRLAHPLHLTTTELAAWAELFADYEIVQPFPQLGRVTGGFTPQEAAGSRLARFEGRTVPVGRLLGLTKRGWQRGEPQDAGVEVWFHKPLAEGRHLVIDLHPGIAVGAVAHLGDQTFEAVRLGTDPDDEWRSDRTPLRLGDLDAVTASELLAELEELTSS